MYKGRTNTHVQTQTQLDTKCTHYGKKLKMVPQKQPATPYYLIILAVGVFAAA